MTGHDQDAGHAARTFDRLTGAILDQRYRIDSKLAAGGFGSIYRGMDLVMGREVALKILHRELADDPNVVERFRREASALAKLRDPHTITMYDVGESPDGTRYIVMELLRGESLHDQFHAHGKRLPWRRVVRIARGVCSSLREAHAVGIVHRDLKPANIHLEQHALERDYVKVLDFGIAKLIDRHEPNRDLTLAGQLVGTFDYMPPEQMIGGMCTGKSDVFTLGIVIYEMIAGERPLGEAKGPATMLMQMLGTTPRSLAESASVPAALDAIVLRAIAHDPELRPDIFELDEELARILDDTVDLSADDARFADDDGPTWIGPMPGGGAPAHTVLGTFAPVAPATPTQRSQFAVGSRTAIPPVSTAVTRQPSIRPVTPTVAPVNVRFYTPSVPADAPPITPPARMPSGTTPIQNEPTGAHAVRSEWRAGFLRGFVWALLVAALGIAIYVWM